MVPVAEGPSSCRAREGDKVGPLKTTEKTTQSPFKTPTRETRKGRVGLARFVARTSSTLQFNRKSPLLNESCSTVSTAETSCEFNSRELCKTPKKKQKLKVRFDKRRRTVQTFERVSEEEKPLYWWSAEELQEPRIEYKEKRKTCENLNNYLHHYQQALLNIGQTASKTSADLMQEIVKGAKDSLRGVEAFSSQLSKQRETRIKEVVGSVVTAYKEEAAAKKGAAVDHEEIRDLSVMLSTVSRLWASTLAHVDLKALEEDLVLFEI
jgi:hypothetical protein